MRSCPYTWFLLIYGILVGRYAFTIGIGCCGGLFFKKQRAGQLDRTPQNPPADPPVGQIYDFGGPEQELTYNMPLPGKITSTAEAMSVSDKYLHDRFKEAGLGQFSAFCRKFSPKTGEFF